MKVVLCDNGYKRRWGLRCLGATARAGAHLEGNYAENVWLRPGGDGGGLWGSRLSAGDGVGEGSSSGAQTVQERATNSRERLRVGDQFNPEE